jgi:hypothetical protein
MRSHRRRSLGTVAAALCLGLDGGAAPGHAMPADHFHAPAPVQQRIGDTPADFAQPVAPAPKIGDTPVDHPGASRAPKYDPPTRIVVNRPVRAIVRDVDELLPIVFSGTALLLALAGLAVALTRGRMGPRPGH